MEKSHKSRNMWGLSAHYLSGNENFVRKRQNFRVRFRKLLRNLRRSHNSANHKHLCNFSSSFENGRSSCSVILYTYTVWSSKAFENKKKTKLKWWNWNGIISPVHRKIIFSLRVIIKAYHRRSYEGSPKGHVAVPNHLGKIRMNNFCTALLSVGKVPSGKFPVVDIHSQVPQGTTKMSYWPTGARKSPTLCRKTVGTILVVVQRSFQVDDEARPSGTDSWDKWREVSHRETEPEDKKTKAEGGLGMNHWKSSDECIKQALEKKLYLGLVSENI